MKKIFISMFILLLMLLSFDNIYAECNDVALNNWAEEVEIKFQEVKNDEYPYAYLLMLSKPRSDLKVVAQDIYSDGTYEVEFDNDFKNYVIGSEVHMEDKEYIITLYMSDSAESCAGEKMRTIKYTVPAYNKFNDTIYCENNPDDEVCGAYTKVEKPDITKDLIDKYYEDEIENELHLNKTIFEKAWLIIKEYWLYVIIPLLVVTLTYEIIIFITKKKGENK